MAPRTKRADAGTLAAKAAAKVARDRADAGKLPQEYEAEASGKGSAGAGHGLARFLRGHSFNEWPGPRPTQASARWASRSGRASDNARPSPQPARARTSVSLTAHLVRRREARTQHFFLCGPGAGLKKKVLYENTPQRGHIRF